jgi:RNA polymerase sigma-70 factor, ECF subfamily
MTNPGETSAESPGAPGQESRRWLRRLGASGPERDAAVAELHTLLLKASRFEIERRRSSLPHLRGRDFDDLAQQSAGDALLALLSKLDQFRGESRFTTWAYKFALLEAGVKVRRRTWQGWRCRWRRRAGRGWRMPRRRSPRQRHVLIAVALNDVPIDVLAERLETTRGALYKTLHDARRKLRAALAGRGFEFDSNWKEER